MLSIKESYEVIKIVENQLEESRENNEGLKSYLIGLKKDVRRITKHGLNDPRLEECHIIIEKGYDSWIEKTVFNIDGNVINNDIEGFKEWFVDQFRIPVFYSEYDCTGRTFTQSIEFYQVGNKLFVYHFKAIDC